MAAIQETGYALEHVRQQTSETCMTAVQQYGLALQYVQQQTPEICMVAVQQNGLALQFIQQQTPEICMAAVQQNEFALEYVHQQTLEICMAAIQQYGITCMFIKSELFDYDEYVYMMYVAIYKSQIFCHHFEIDTIENRIDYLKKYCEHITHELINDIMTIKCRSTKKAV
jgi:hypothetical protein